MRIGQKRARHRDHVRIARGKYVFGKLGCVDPVRGDHRDRHGRFHVGCRLAPGTARHRIGDRRHAGLVPADAGVQNIRTCGLDLAGQCGNFIGGRAALDQIGRRNPVDDQKVGAATFAHRAHDLDRESVAVRGAAAPVVLALVGMGDGEFVDQVSLGPHDLDAIKACGLRIGGRHGKILDGTENVGFGHFTRDETVDRSADRRRGDTAFDLGIAPGVEELRADQAAFGLHRLADRAQVKRFFRAIDSRTFWIEYALGIGRKPAGDQNRRLPPRTLGVKRDLFGYAVRLGFQPRVHRPHDDTISQCMLACADGREHGFKASIWSIFHFGSPPQNCT